MSDLTGLGTTCLGVQRYGESRMLKEALNTCCQSQTRPPLDTPTSPIPINFYALPIAVTICALAAHSKPLCATIGFLNWDESCGHSRRKKSLGLVLGLLKFQRYVQVLNFSKKEFILCDLIMS